MRGDAAAWPPTAIASKTIVSRPSDARYTAAAKPAGPAPTMSRSQSIRSVPGTGSPMTRASSAGVGWRRTATTSPGWRTTALTNAASPVRRLISPRNRPGPWSPSTCSSPLPSPSTIATVPRTITKKVRCRSPLVEDLPT